MVEQAVFERHRPARFGVVHPARQHAGYARQFGREATPQVGTAPAVDVHDVRPMGADRLLEPQDHAQIRVATHGHLDHLGKGARLGCDVRTARAGEHIAHAARGQALHDVEHLFGAAVKVATGFDVQHLHADSTSRASAITRSGRMSRRQVKAPSQVGRRRQGEQSMPSQITLALARPVSR